MPPTLRVMGHVQRNLLALVALLLLGGLLLVLALGSRSRTEPSATTGEPAPGATTGNPVTTAPGETPTRSADPARTELPDEPAALTRPADAGPAVVTVRVVRNSDDAPVADLPVALLPEGAGPWDEGPSQRTDTAGHARFTVAPGAYRALASTGGTAACVAKAGEGTTVILRLRRGFRLLGTVVDRGGVAVVDASIWLSEPGRWQRGAVVARTDREGTFTIDDVQGVRYVSAAHARYAPSALQYVHAEPGEQVRLRCLLQVEPGTVAGTVFDSDGAPVVGARLLVGPDTTARVRTGTAGSVLPPPPVLAHSDAAGRFAARGLEPGRLPVSVEARGFGPWEGEVEVQAGRTVSLSVTLPAPANLTGRATHADGHPLANLQIWTGARGGFLSRTATTDAAGRYLLQELPPGTLQASVWRLDVRLLTAELQLRSGTTTTWDPVVVARDPSTALLRGRVLDHRGEPQAGYRIAAQDLGGSGRLEGTRTGGDGRFELTSLQRGSTVQLRAFGPDRSWSDHPDAVLNGVVVDGSEVTIQVPDPAFLGVLRLRTLGPDGAPIVADVNLWQEEQQLWSRHKTSADGRFETRLHAGTLGIDITHAEHPRVRLLGQTVPAGGSLDLGDVLLQAGCAVFGRIHGASGEVPESANVRVLSGLSEVGSASYQSGSFRTGALPAGDYVLLVQAQGFASSRVPVQLQPGEQREQDVTLPVGALRRVRIAAPAEADAGGWVSLRVVDDQGQLRGLFGLPLEQFRAEATLWATEGTYRVLATGARQWRGEGVLEVLDHGEAPPLEIALRRD